MKYNQTIWAKKFYDVFIEGVMNNPELTIATIEELKITYMVRAVLHAEGLIPVLPINDKRRKE